MDHLRLDVPHFFRIRALPRFFGVKAFLSVDSIGFKDSSYCSILEPGGMENESSIWLTYFQVTNFSLMPTYD